MFLKGVVSRNNMVAIIVLSLFLTAAYVHAWNHFHPRLHHMTESTGPLTSYEKWIRRNHSLHHLQKGSKKGNNNILVPLADHLLGKYRYCVDNDEYFAKKLARGESLGETEAELAILAHGPQKDHPISNNVYFCTTGISKIL